MQTMSHKQMGSLSPVWCAYFLCNGFCKYLSALLQAMKGMKCLSASCLRRNVTRVLLVLQCHMSPDYAADRLK